MTLSDAAEQNLKNGDPAAALARLQEDVRARPSDRKLRVFLFQLLCVLGQWERALNQLKVASELDPAALPMAQMYGDAVRCEAIRTAVFEGSKSPMVLGEPEQWLALLIESRLRAGSGEAAQAEELRVRAFEAAPGSGGDIDGRPFEWIADADSRLGPVMEAIINGRYYWVPEGWMRAAKYFLEDLGVDVNVRDADGFTALHHAAARGDNETIQYLLSRGADIMVVNRAGQTTVDMANSPEQRTQPFPATIALLEGMGAKNNNNCRACK